jgi:nitroreductase
MKILKSISVSALWLMLSGCQTVNTDDDRPARIVDPDADSRAALQAAVNEALGTEVMLADTALTDRSRLTIERWPAGTMDNPVPQGRILEKPIQFRLVINGSDCILIDQRDSARYVLEKTSCEAE